MQVQIGFHHDRERGLVDPPVSFQQDGEERASADERGRFGIGQLLVDRFGGDPGSIGDVGEIEFGEFELGEKVEQGRLGESYRVVSSVRSLVCSL